MRPLIIGITGSIASGKSTASKYLESKGFKIYYTDKIGHDVLDYPEVKQDLVTNFGHSVIVNGNIDRQEVREIVFKDKSKLETLNSITHPQIFKTMQDLVDKSKEKVIFFEVPLLFEANMATMFDCILVIDIAKEIQLKRLIKRNNFSEEQAQRIIDSQMPSSDKLKLADYSISNNTSESNLIKGIDNFISTIKNIASREIKPFYERT